ncbi:SDR family oxidoreductase [Cohnella panacarvi]|uniref:SDR family oxidoreductase n=1 Tax=Cohnella panacarvi TaxID=400776 RepID=UPI00047C6742|nr:SDR family oxidoreductase [Cohnella panacarvi]
MKMLVTGATGKLGTEVVDALLKTVPADRIAASVRNPEKAVRLREQGVEVRQGDFDQPATLDSAFAGIDRLLIISTDGDTETRIRQHTNAIEAAARAKVGFIAYTSLAGATDSTILFAPPHQVAEKAIKQTGIPYSFLRNNWYLENELPSIQGVIAGAPWVTSAGSGKVGWALHQEYAEAAAAVLAGEGHENTVYELSGPLLTQEQLAAAIGGVLGKEVPVQQVDDATYAEIMKQAGVPDFAIPIVVGIQQGIRAGSLAIESNDFQKLLGRPLAPISEALRRLMK